MARKKGNAFMNPNQIEVAVGNSYYYHYQQYLYSLAFQLFKWEGLPDTVDPRYLEMSLHMFGHVGFYKHPHLGFIAIQGSPSGRVNHYLLPTDFHGVAPQLKVDFRIYHYTNLTPRDNDGIVIWNNDFHYPTLPSLVMFAKDLAELKEIIRINANAQKTPFIIHANDDNKFSVQNVYNQIEGNGLSIFVHESLDMEKVINVHRTDAPYVVDKLNTQKNAIWNEVMTYMGINNANLEKRERMVKSEAESNNEQIESSGNVFLKAREEACDRINHLYPELNVSVKFREGVIEQFESQLERGVDVGKLHNGVT